MTAQLVRECFARNANVSSAQDWVRSLGLSTHRCSHVYFVWKLFFCK